MFTIGNKCIKCVRGMRYEVGVYAPLRYEMKLVVDSGAAVGRA